MMSSLRVDETMPAELLAVLDTLANVSSLLDTIVVTPLDTAMVGFEAEKARSTLAMLRDRLSLYAETGAVIPFGPLPPAPLESSRIGPPS